MKVNSCMSIDVRTTAPNETIRDAARLMKEIDAGFLPVGDNDRLVGMITDRDIAVRGVAEGRGPDTPVRDVMSREVLYCYEDDDLDDVARQMRELQVRRMPVLNRDKRMIGVISLGDIAQAEAPEKAGRALGGISEPGGLHTQ